MTDSLSSTVPRAIRSVDAGHAATILSFPTAPAPSRGVDWKATVAVGGILTLGLGLRLWHLNTLGYNSDEAVYAGQAAALANNPDLTSFFPIVRAHPMIFQFLLALTFHYGVSDLAGRLLSVAFGIGTLFLVYRLGRLLYGGAVGILATLFMTVMPYHVVVTRQILLDGPMTFFTTLTLYLLARFAVTARPTLLWAVGASLGLVFLTKETGFVVAAAVYAFLALNSSLRIRFRDLVLSMVCLVVVMASYPVSLTLAGGGASKKAQGYLIWQLFRRSNHGWTFYPAVVPPAVGPLLLVAAAAGLGLLWRHRSWRETLLVSWIVVPTVVFQMWPVKGFQYLLPAAPAVAILAARFLVCWPGGRAAIVESGSRRWIRAAIVGVVVLSIALPTWQRLQPPTSTDRLAGAGGTPGGRELGTWIRTHTPTGAVFVTIGPSMANIVQFYGHRKAYGLSVSPNPLHRNPSYEPIVNADSTIRHGDAQYLVFDAFSASRSSMFAESLQKYVAKYHGREVHAESMPVTAADGTVAPMKIIVVYEVQPT